ncbi:hypothetical protein [Streptomyces dysideae]|uniref:hypothetical protein n=1 Tax=Streptomyces dysideae TaxID=909626 RepID=UPI0008322E87|nr:hypothetical protein [Streptomyces dysideae]
MWFAVAGSVLGLALLGLALLAALGLGAYTVYRMSDPADTLDIGIRIDGSRISVKAPVCPTDLVERVEVFDGRSEEPLWQATGPKTPEARRGTITLWQKADFLSSKPEAGPRRLPKELDVSIEYAGVDDGTGNVFSVSEVAAAHVPEGQYWTDHGPMTAQDIDDQLKCSSAGESPSRLQ